MSGRSERRSLGKRRSCLGLRGFVPAGMRVKGCGGRWAWSWVGSAERRRRVGGEGSSERAAARVVAYLPMPERWG